MTPSEERNVMFMTSNKHKIREVFHIFDGGRENYMFNFLFSSPSSEIPEEELTLKGNAVFKAEACYRYIPDGVLGTLSDDSGLFVHALRGLPGVRSARYAEDNNAGKGDDACVDFLLDRMRDVDSRKAYLSSVVAFHSPSLSFSVEGHLQGTITRERRGASCFGYSQVFLPDDCSLTLSEMEDRRAAGTDSVSSSFLATKTHRAIAVKHALSLLNTYISERTT